MYMIFLNIIVDRKRITYLRGDTAKEHPPCTPRGMSSIERSVLGLFLLICKSLSCDVLD